MRGQPDVLLVWFNLLAHAPSGVSDRTLRTISEETGLSQQRVRKAIEILEAPDTESRTPDEQGRRIVRLDEHRSWGWRIVNWEYYRNLLSEADKRAKDAERQRRHRMSQASVTGCDELGRDVTPASASASVQGKGMQGEGELTFEQAMDRVPIQLREQVKPDFARMVFDAWDGRDGKDASGVQVRFEKHLRKRWNAEGEQWANNCHQTQRKAKESKSSVDSTISRDIARGSRRMDNFDTTLPD